MFPSRAPFDAEHLIVAAIREQVPAFADGAGYVAPVTDASEPMQIPGVVFDDFDADNTFSYQDLLATTFWLSVHVYDRDRAAARRRVREVWLALMRAPSLDLSQVDDEQRILAVFDGGAPVENRTQGQALHFHEFRFTIRVMVGRLPDSN